MTEPAGAPRTAFALTRRRHPAAADTGGAASARPRPARAAAARGHWLALVLLGAGLALRVLALLAYRPALIYVDSLKYLYGASPGSEPLGYTVALKALVPLGGLVTVAAVQHLAGLAMGVLLYTVLLRRGLPRWAAALAVAPVLLDAYQVQMEQMIMPDVWFEAFVLTSIAILVWRPVVSVPFAIAAGLVLGSSATLKQLGEILVVPVLAYLLAAGGETWRARGRAAAALFLAFLLPVLAYCTVSYARTGHFWLAHKQTDTGRLLAAADCATLKVPAAARRLCPTPAEQARGPDWLEHSGSSPVYAPLPPGLNRQRGQLIGELKSAVLGQQPLRVVVSVASDALRLYAPVRSPSEWVSPLSRWQFQTGYPTFPPWTDICVPRLLSATACMDQQTALSKRVAPVTDMLVRPDGTIVVGVQHRAFVRFHARTLAPSYGGPARVDRPLAAFLRSYQLYGGYTPGPLFALFTLTALAASVLALTRRGRTGPAGRLAQACLLFTATAVVLLLVPDFFEFSWRYELPAVVTLPPAGILGLAALWRLRVPPRSGEGSP